MHGLNHPNYGQRGRGHHTYLNYGSLTEFDIKVPFLHPSHVPDNYLDDESCSQICAELAILLAKIKART